MPGVTIMSALEMRGFALGVALCFGAATASAQTTFPETEPNSLKTEANQVTCMQAGDILTGTTTGARSPGGSLVTTADVPASSALCRSASTSIDWSSQRRARPDTPARSAA